MAAIGESSGQLAIRDPDVRLMLRVRDDDQEVIVAVWTRVAPSPRTEEVDRHRPVGGHESLNDLCERRVVNGVR